MRACAACAESGREPGATPGQARLEQVCARGAAAAAVEGRRLRCPAGRVAGCCRRCFDAPCGPSKRGLLTPLATRHAPTQAPGAMATGKWGDIVEDELGSGIADRSVSMDMREVRVVVCSLFFLRARARRERVPAS